MFGAAMISTVAISLLATIAASAPVASTENLAERQVGTVTATMIGAAGAQYTMELPLDSSWHWASNPLSISHITTTGGPCAFFGVDGTEVDFDGAATQAVGPPQTITGGACGPKPAGDWKRSEGLFAGTTRAGILECKRDRTC